MNNWESGASLNSLRQRARLLTNIRNFFSARSILEVETPLLGHGTATDVYIQSIKISAVDTNPSLYLQTSPEFFMKRLLASGSGPIFQICKAFRQGEESLRHNPEFSMLEWYQPGYSLQAMMDEVEELMLALEITGEQKIDAQIPRFSYREVFEKHLGFNPHSVGFDKLQSIAHEKIDLSTNDLSSTDYLQLLLSSCIEPVMPSNWFIYDFPVKQAALARISKDSEGELLARRFELYCGGMEIANGYHELTEAGEQRERFRSDLDRRKELGLEQYPIDEKLIAALDHGLPDCAGVAIGIDRLLMLITNCKGIGEVISFTTERT